MVRSTSEQSIVQRASCVGIRAACGAVLLATALPAALSAQGDRPQTHTVKAGDTLWGLARQYLGDPFLWPEIYRRNTQVVEDPHWIYPGEVLRLAGGDAVASVPATDTPAPSAEPAAPPRALPAPSAMSVRPVADSADMSPLFSQSERASLMRETLRAYSDQPYRPLRRSEFYSSGFLTEGKDLPFGRLAARVTPPQIQAVSTRVSATMYTDIVVAPPAGASYQVGDSLLIAMLGPDLRGSGRIVHPTGLARVTDISNGLTVASIVAVYGPIRSEQYMLPAERFSDAGSV
nr:LysM peptidoglycan-binding domain-containing protein [Gemmatimonadales bacterium]